MTVEKALVPKDSQQPPAKVKPGVEIWLDGKGLYREDRIRGLIEELDAILTALKAGQLDPETEVMILAKGSFTNGHLGILSTEMTRLAKVDMLADAIKHLVTHS